MMPAHKQLNGFIDLQVNGYRGVDFSNINLTIEDAAFAIRGLLANGGCAGILPTIISSSLDIYDHNLPIFAKLIEMEEFKGRILGLHLEGPFISPKKGAVGCHNSKNVRAPSVELLSKWQLLAKGNICMVTVAAEAEDVAEFIKYCVDNKIVVSLGHQLANVEQVNDAVNAGACAMTHLGNGLPNLIHRHKNIIWKGLSDDRLSIMLITDGNHLPKELIRVMFRSKPLPLIIVTSDVAPVAGMPDGKYDCFGTKVFVEGNNVRDATGPNLAGSGSLMFACIDHLCCDNIWPLYYDVNNNLASNLEHLDRKKQFTMKMVGYLNPLRLIDINEKEMYMKCPMNLVTWKNGRFHYTATLV